MEKLNRPKLEDLPELEKLKDNWQQWGDECKAEKRSWPSSRELYLAIRNELEGITKDHCSFCDDKPLGAKSRQTIEHYFPKGKSEFPCLTFAWENLFYCCDKCQSNANSDKPFKYTLKPDNEAYFFEDYFYYDTEKGELKILENLAKEKPEKFSNATAFLKRYGLSGNTKLNIARRDEYNNILNKLQNDNNPLDQRNREDFAFRFVYDAAKAFYEIRKNQSL